MLMIFGQPVIGCPTLAGHTALNKQKEGRNRRCSDLHVQAPHHEVI